jgi:hypothetical protein
LAGRDVEVIERGVVVLGGRTVVVVARATVVELVREGAVEPELRVAPLVLAAVVLVDVVGPGGTDGVGS